MATLNEVHQLVNGSPDLRQRFLAARVEACWDVAEESPSTTNHANRLSWAESILDDYNAHSQREYTRFLANATIQTNGNSSTDNDIQYVVNESVDSWADDYVGV